MTVAVQALKRVNEKLHVNSDLLVVVSLGLKIIGSPWCDISVQFCFIVFTFTCFFGFISSVKHFSISLENCCLNISKSACKDKKNKVFILRSRDIREHLTQRRKESNYQLFPACLGEHCKAILLRNTTNVLCLQAPSKHVRQNTEQKPTHRRLLSVRWFLPTT